MPAALGKLVVLWNSISQIGVADSNYSETRRIILSNQIAILGVITPQFYNLFYAVHDLDLLMRPILVNVAGSFICLLVICLNYLRHHKLAKYIIILCPNIQIFLLTYYLSTASGMHLLHIMMISFVLFLLSTEKRAVIICISAIPLALYFISFVMFTPDFSPIILDANVLMYFYIAISLTVFLLIFLFFALFYKEILFTEKLLQRQHELSENLLLNILPHQVAQRLKSEPGIIAELFPSVTILFADIVGFTRIASLVKPSDLVKTLNEIFLRYDQLVDNLQLEKIKTIGDAYMVAGGIPVSTTDHTERIAQLALSMLEVTRDFEVAGEKLHVRIGFHSGPVVAGVIGKKKFSYDIWGDAVNIASRLESHGISNKIHVSENVREKLQGGYRFEKRGLVNIKGIGEMETWFLVGENESAPATSR